MAVLRGLGTWGRVKVGKSPMPGKDGWFPEEKQVCAKYVDEYVAALDDKKLYQRAHSYAGKLGELGRQPTPKASWAAIFALTGAEGALFSATMLPYVSQVVTEEMLMPIAGALGVVIAGILSWTTHEMGKERYRNERVKFGGDLMRKDLRVKDLSAIMRDKDVGLAKDEVDDDKELWQQMINRLKCNNAKFTPSHGATTVGAGALVTVGVAMLTIRMSAYAATGGGYDFGEFDQGGWSAEDLGAWATNMLLLVMFTLVQGLAVLTGYQHSFSGLESHKAYKILRKYKSAEEYEMAHKAKRIAIANKVNRELYEVQREIIGVLEKTGSDGSRPFKATEKFSEHTFEAYIRQRLKDDEDI